MRQRIGLGVTVALTLAGLLLVPSALAADGSNSGDDVAIRINGPVVVASGETLDVAVVVNGAATVQGTVTSALVVVDGDATVSGTVDGQIVVASGHLTLEPSARVHDVTLIQSDLTRAPGAQVSGNIEQRSRVISRGFLTFLSIVWWVGLTSLVLLLGLLLTAIGRWTLTASAGLITARTAETIVAGVIVAIGLPILIVVLLLTVIGIPIGIALIFVAMALAFAGYVVSGLRLGEALVDAVSSGPRVAHPFVAVVVGLLILQLIGLIPILGGLIVLVASIIGSGALALLAWRGWRGPRPARVPAPPAGGEREPAG